VGESTDAAITTGAGAVLRSNVVVGAGDTVGDAIGEAVIGEDVDAASVS